MIPERFAIEYPQRCLTLLKALEPMARRERLLGSFCLLVASSVLVIPFERMQVRHPMHRKGTDNDLDGALRRLKRQPFHEAAFWNGEDPGEWRLSRIMRFPNDTGRWVDEKGIHPMAADAENLIRSRTAGEVLRWLRNALAHGNVVYLNENGREQRSSELQYLGFMSRYEETDHDRKSSDTYRLLVTTDERFLRFIKAWAQWVASFRLDARLSEAA
jgi:hypothetical protein